MTGFGMENARPKVVVVVFLRTKLCKIRIFTLRMDQAFL